MAPRWRMRLQPHRAESAHSRVDGVISGYSLRARALCPFAFISLPLHRPAGGRLHGRIACLTAGVRRPRRVTRSVRDAVPCFTEAEKLKPQAGFACYSLRHHARLLEGRRRRRGGRRMTPRQEARRISDALTAARRRLLSHPSPRAPGHRLRPINATEPLSFQARYRQDPQAYDRARRPAPGLAELGMGTARRDRLTRLHGKQVSPAAPGYPAAIPEPAENA